MTFVIGMLVIAAVTAVSVAPFRPRPPTFPERVATLMRSGGWQSVTVTAAMGHLGTDVVGVGADGRRWLIRCHQDPARLTPADVHRFADTARQLRRSEVTVLVTAGTPADPIRRATLRAGVTLVDAETLAWWTALQRGPSPAEPRAFPRPR